MKSFWTIIFSICLFIPISQAQDSEPKTLKTLFNNQQVHGGFFGGISFKATEFQDNSTVLMGVKFGGIINRAVAIGFEGHGIIPSTTYAGIHDVQEVRLLGGYGGLLIEPILFSNRLIHVTFPISSGAGWLGYHKDWENDDYTGWEGNDDLLDEDVFWYIEPGITAELNVTKNVRFGLGISKRFTQDLELQNTASDAFDKMNYSFVIKIGRF